jgi:hypothetical protein
LEWSLSPLERGSIPAFLFGLGPVLFRLASSFVRVGIEVAARLQNRNGGSSLICGALI